MSNLLTNVRLYFIIIAVVRRVTYLVIFHTCFFWLSAGTSCERKKKMIAGFALGSRAAVGYVFFSFLNRMFQRKSEEGRCERKPKM